MLGSALIVCLMGIMYEALDISGNQYTGYGSSWVRFWLQLMRRYMLAVTTKTALRQPSLLLCRSP
jgi:hypothetical protein